MTQLKHQDERGFEGFTSSKETYFRVPNDIFSILRQYRERYGSRIGPDLVFLLYLLRHLWGFKDFASRVFLSSNAITHGRKRKHAGRFDRGTGLAKPTITKTANRLAAFGMINVERRSATSIPCYSIRLKPEAEASEEETNAFIGFRYPKSNYFIVDSYFTDMIRDLSSAVTIMALLYLFRHCWGYQNPSGVWLSANEFMNGRMKNGKERYDEGIGFDRVSISRALIEGVNRGLLVWRPVLNEETGKTMKEYNLRLEGMVVADDGRFLDMSMSEKHAEIAGVKDGDTLPENQSDKTPEVDSVVASKFRGSCADLPVICTDEHVGSINGQANEPDYLLTDDFDPIAGAFAPPSIETPEETHKEMPLEDTTANTIGKGSYVDDGSQREFVISYIREIGYSRPKQVLERFERDPDGVLRMIDAIKGSKSFIKNPAGMLSDFLAGKLVASLPIERHESARDKYVNNPYSDFIQH